MSGDDPARLGKGRAVTEREKSLFVLTREFGGRWIPKAAIHDDSEVFKRGDEGEVVVAQWWAERELGL